MNLDKYYGDGDGDGDGDYVHVLSNHILLGLIFHDYELVFDFVSHKHHYLSLIHISEPTRR